jgi:hypothetical protein
MPETIHEVPKPAVPTREPFVDAETAGKHLSVSYKTMHNLAAKGRIPAYNYGTAKKALWRFKISELDAQRPVSSAPMTRYNSQHNTP